MVHFFVEDRAHFHLASPHALKVRILKWGEKAGWGETAWSGTAPALLEEKYSFRTNSLCPTKSSSLSKLPLSVQTTYTEGLGLDSLTLLP
jgi:hypothetical protein